MEVRQIVGDNEWVRIESGSVAGWVRASRVVIEADSFVEGYRLDLMSPEVTEEEFQERCGYTLEEVKKIAFEEKEEAITFGDSLAAMGLLHKHAATGLYFDIWVSFNEAYPNVNTYYCGGDEALGGAYPLKCPVCEDVLSKVHAPEIHVKRIADFDMYKDLSGMDAETVRLSGLEIYECVRGHLVILQRIVLD